MEERIQKLISEAGICSRRAAEKLIAEKKVKINGEVAQIGDKADKESDVIFVDGRRLRFEKKYVYIMLNKPRGYVTTLNDELGRQSVADLVKNCGTRVYPVGRLDKDSEGLLLLTNDGELTQSLTHPKGEIDKTYVVKVVGEVDNICQKLSRMTELDGEKISRAKATLLERNGRKAIIEMTIHQGKNRQIRRMCKACGAPVVELKRIREDQLELGDLKLGTWRYLTNSEIDILKGKT